MKKISSLFSKIRLNRGGKFLGIGMNPETDWKIMVITFIFLLSVTLTACAYYFIRVNSGDFLVAIDGEATPTSTFNINRVRQTVNHYKTKAVELEKIKLAPENIPDPSL